MLVPGWEAYLGTQTTASAKGGSVAAALLSEQLRLLTPDADIPRGCVVGSHSWREMMALAAYRAGKNWLRAAEFGFWRNPTTMWSSYVQLHVITSVLVLSSVSGVRGDCGF